MLLLAEGSTAGTWIGLIFVIVVIAMISNARDKSKNEAADRAGVPQVVFTGYSGYEGAPTRQDLTQPVVVRTLARMTAPKVRELMIRDFAANGYSMTDMTRTTSGKTILTFVRQGG